MAINGTTAIIILVIILVGYAIYATQGIQKKIYCTFIRADRTRIDKWCKKEQTRIDFDGGWYYIVPSRVILITWDKGIFSLFPTKVQSLLFKHDSNQPLDPADWSNDFEKPEDRKYLDKSEDLKALGQGNQQALSASKQKVSGLQAYMPFIMIIGFLIVGYFVYQLMGRIDKLGMGQNYIEGVMGEIMNRLPK